MIAPKIAKKLGLPKHFGFEFTKTWEKEKKLLYPVFGPIFEIRCLKIFRADAIFGRL